MPHRRPLSHRRPRTEMTRESGVAMTFRPEAASNERFPKHHHAGLTQHAQQIRMSPGSHFGALGWDSLQLPAT